MCSVYNCCLQCIILLTFFDFFIILCFVLFFFFNDTATTEIYTYCHTLSLRDALPILSLIFTRVAVGGCTHALNIIDGMNGLAGMIATLMALSLGLVALQVQDIPIFLIAAALASATLGFLVWNFPFGRVFLGDGGAYFVGFILAELAVQLVVRNPSVSPFYALAVLFYPVFETLFSIWRRRYKRGVPVDQPDALHLHQMVFRRLVRSTFRDRKSTRLNSSH